MREELAKNISNRPCADCGGTRLRPEARNVYIGKNEFTDDRGKKVLVKRSNFSLHFLSLVKKHKLRKKILKEIRERLQFLVNVGLNYLSLSRSAETLSGGEAQRIRLASQIGAGLVGVMYVLDEPSIGLHQRDNERLLNTLIHLRNLGNTVIVVEHDEDAIRAADHIIDIGPGAGVHGGQVIAQGNADEIMLNPNSITGKFLSGADKIDIPKKRTALDKKKMAQT